MRKVNEKKMQVTSTSITILLKLSKPNIKFYIFVSSYPLQ